MLIRSEWFQEEMTIRGFELPRSKFEHALSRVRKVTGAEVNFHERTNVFLAFCFGLLIGALAGLIGVAGGEFRIPLLIYAFGLDVVVAGTTSLLISIPTVAMGFKKHHQMGSIGRKATAVAVVMGVGSVMGAIAGASYVAAIDKDVLKILLGAALMLTTIRMVTKP